MPRTRGLLVVAALAAGSVGGLSGAAYTLLNTQSRRARTLIGVPRDAPFNADGDYFPDGSGPAPLGAAGAAVEFGVFGDSSAAGLGAETPDLLPGVLLARGLAEECDRAVRLRTYAVSGSRTTGLVAQVDRALAAPPAVALILVGGNDVTARLAISTSAALLATQVRRLTEAGTAVVVGTCPDLGAIQPIPQPLRSVARKWSLALGRAQARALVATSAAVVPMTLLSRHFLTRPGELFSSDRFHPNGAGYALAAGLLLPALCGATGTPR
ncbi:SGNH/GDSL hydrolase family protein [Actinokineospora auranticolor]|uniref:Lysophospholipase L1-like esterase n=1 Tax=Actinokineospora auranticolor TaxID=155976 RepID=A0A2S6GYP6_9PSEU|nr:SGNH/GDSL hydrolase family protein [Actinokineospora auranticolor]PPK70286.1 lysophospholipase L1-like esterase [Actinokineospora auranticolor]